MRAGYLDCFAGASGDMILGALVDAGLSLETLRKELKKIRVKGYELEARKVERNHLSATQVTVSIPQSRKKTYRYVGEIKSTIAKSSLSDRIKEKGIAIFENLARAESKVHRVPPEEVRLYEVGAVDAIVDVMGAVIGFELLGIEKLYASPLPSGRGSVKIEHGYYPVPAPVTMELLAQARAPLVVSDEPWRGETVTPTGAAIIATLASFQRPTLTLEAVGYGAGSRELAEMPNVLRLWVGQEMAGGESLVLLETNIDDMSPEIAGYVMERLFQLGARDVWFSPIFMKKNRPAMMLSVLASWEKEETLAEALLRETTTLGLRVRPVARHEAEREVMEFAFSLGKVGIKIKRFKGQVLSASPEYEDCRRIALEKDLPLQEVFRIVEEEARKKLPASEKPAHQLGTARRAPTRINK